MFLLWLRQLPWCGDQTPASIPHLPRAGPVILTLLFSPLVPQSYRVFHGSIYYFPLVRYSCLLSDGVLHALLCLKLYSWCIRGERCTPHPPTPPPSCSLWTSCFWMRWLFLSFLPRMHRVGGQWSVFENESPLLHVFTSLLVRPACYKYAYSEYLLFYWVWWGDPVHHQSLKHLWKLLTTHLMECDLFRLAFLILHSLVPGALPSSPCISEEPISLFLARLFLHPVSFFLI